MKEEIKMKNRMKKLLVLATAATMMTPFTISCQYGETPIYVRP